ncbi:MAG: chorismate lyase [Arenicellales bacterium]
MGETPKWRCLADIEHQLTQMQIIALSDQGSLTRQIRLSCEATFDVHLISSAEVAPNAQEVCLLQLDKKIKVISRKVYLRCHKIPQIFAKTIIGLSSENQTFTDKIKALGEQSLGSILFKDPLARKQAVGFAQLSAQDAFFEDAFSENLNSYYWVRRNLYDYEGVSLIVYEAFLSEE